MATFVSILLFLVFVEDSNCAYAFTPGALGAPMGWLHPYLLEPSFVKLRPFDLAMLGVLLSTLFRKDSKPPIAPMRNALLLVLGTTAFWFAYGVIVRGGDARFASWQTYLILSMVLVSFTIGSVFRTARDYSRLGWWLVAAAFYRAAMCWISYFTWGRKTLGESGAFLTSHDDTIVWVVSIVILILDTVDKRSLKTTLRNLVLGLFFMGAIQFNSRRLAWVSLAMALVVAYLLLPRGSVKRRIERTLLYVSPVVILYVVVGWGRSGAIFLPLKSLSTVSTQEDGSTLARNAENLSLIATNNISSFAFGTGWGKPYMPLTRKYDIAAAFELWQYVPHNSILGLLAFTGALGFAGFWLAVPTSVFLIARVAQLSEDPKARTVAIVGAAQLIVCANQLYADMGAFDLKPMYVIAATYAMAMRLPASAGVWRAAAPQPAKT